MGAALVAVLAASIMVWSPNVWVLIAGRFVAGYGGGIAVVQGACAQAPLHTGATRFARTKVRPS